MGDLWPSWSSSSSMADCSSCRSSVLRACRYFDSEGNMKELGTEQLCKGKKVVLFAVPGAFTPTCSMKHLPGFIEKAEEIKVWADGCVRGGGQGQLSTGRYQPCTYWLEVTQRDCVAASQPPLLCCAALPPVCRRATATGQGR